MQRFTIAQYMVLECLEAGRVTVKEIAAHQKKAISTIYRTLSMLKNKGWVAHTAPKNWKLTQAGRNKLHENNQALP